MIINSLKKNMLRQYAVLLSGITLSLLMNFICDYKFQMSKNWIKNYNYTWNAYIVTFSYFMLTFYFLTLFVPFINMYKPRIYKSVFYVLLATNILWIYVFGREGGDRLWIIVFSCFPMPTAYLISWYITNKYRLDHSEISKFREQNTN